MSFDQVACAALDEDELELLALLLAPLIVCDGEVSPLEVALFKSFARLHLDEGATDAIRSIMAPPADEIRRRGRRVAETLYLYCALLVCGDKRVHEAELELLRHYGEVLGVGLEQCRALEAQARGFVLDQAAQLMWRLTGEPFDKARYLTVIAQHLGASEDEIDAAWAALDVTE